MIKRSKTGANGIIIAFGPVLVSKYSYKNILHLKFFKDSTYSVRNTQTICKNLFCNFCFFDFCFFNLLSLIQIFFAEFKVISEFLSSKYENTTNDEIEQNSSKRKRSESEFTLRYFFCNLLTNSKSSFCLIRYRIRKHIQNFP